MLVSVLGLSAMATIAGCSTEPEALADKASDESSPDYVTGDGVATELGEDERSQPLNADVSLLDGTTVALSDWRPRPVVINLWYANCPPCRKEAPDLQRLYSELGDSTVQFLGVNVRDQEAATAESFLDTFDITYPNMLDTDSQMVSRLSGLVPPTATPSTVVLDAQGRPAARVIGAIDYSTLRGLVEKVLEE